MQTSLTILSYNGLRQDFLALNFAEAFPDSSMLYRCVQSILALALLINCRRLLVGSDYFCLGEVLLATFGALTFSFEAFHVVRKKVHALLMYFIITVQFNGFCGCQVWHLVLVSRIQPIV